MTTMTKTFPAIFGSTREELTRVAKSCALGCYQHDLIEGRVPWSGAGLQGKASSWGARYAESRENLLDRLDRALVLGIQTALVLHGGRWHRELVIEGTDGSWYRWDEIYDGSGADVPTPIDDSAIR